MGVTSTPLPILVGSMNTVCRTWPPAVVSRSSYSPRRGVIVSVSALTMLWIWSAYTPAAFMTTREKNVAPPAFTFQPGAPPSSVAGSTAVTRALKRKPTPFVAALSASAAVSANGSQMPAVGAHSAATAPSAMFGSIRTSSSRPTMRSSGTPFARPRSSSASSAGMSS